MAKVKNIEKQILDIEGLDVVIRRKDGRDVHTNSTAEGSTRFAGAPRNAHNTSSLENRGAVQ